RLHAHDAAFLAHHPRRHDGVRAQSQRAVQHMVAPAQLHGLHHDVSLSPLQGANTGPGHARVEKQRPGGGFHHQALFRDHQHRFGAQRFNGALTGDVGDPQAAGQVAGPLNLLGPGPAGGGDDGIHQRRPNLRSKSMRSSSMMTGRPWGHAKGLSASASWASSFFIRLMSRTCPALTAARHASEAAASWALKPPSPSHASSTSSSTPVSRAASAPGPSSTGTPRTRYDAPPKGSSTKPSRASSS